MLKPNASRRNVETDQRDNGRDISIRRNSRGVVRADSQSHLPPIRCIADPLKRIIQVVGKHKAANIKTYVRDSAPHPNSAHLGILSGRPYRPRRHLSSHQRSREMIRGQNSVPYPQPLDTDRRERGRSRLKCSILTETRVFRRKHQVVSRDFGRPPGHSIGSHTRLSARRRGQATSAMAYASRPRHRLESLPGPRRAKRPIAFTLSRAYGYMGFAIAAAPGVASA
jgi:hypothetical protein